MATIQINMSGSNVLSQQGLQCAPVKSARALELKRTRYATSSHLRINVPHLGRSCLKNHSQWGRMSARVMPSLSVVHAKLETSTEATGVTTSEEKEVVVTESAGDEAKKSRRLRPGESRGFVEEMRIRAMKLHTKDQAKEGQKPEQAKPMAKWEPTKEGYIQFLVESKVVYEAMEAIVAKAANPLYAEFRNTGLERTEALTKDLAWFESMGFSIPEPESSGKTYAEYIIKLSETDAPAFICHFYNVYFAHSAGGKMIGRKVSEMILDGRELEFYKWEGELASLLSAVKEKINLVSENWSREEKDHCLQETELSFKYSGNLIRLLMS